MLTSLGHLSYCTNIHAGEEWKDHFAVLQENIPLIKERLSWQKPFGIGLRLSNKASLSLAKEENLSAFKKWLYDNNCYVYTMNGFPYGGFHHQRVKDQVHAPDWTTNERLQYTLRMFRILSELLPEGMEGSISTSPLSYKHWFAGDEDRQQEAMEKATWHMLEVAEQLVKVHRVTDTILHLDIEPEPDGLIGNGMEFLHWYLQCLLPMGVPLMMERFSVSREQAEEMIRRHVRLCYDVCHFAIGYEDAQDMLSALREAKIAVGKLQLSAALKADMPQDAGARSPVKEAFQMFDEPTYLHQVIARCQDGRLLHYADLPDALQDIENTSVAEWRAHFHVPLFLNQYGLLRSTQEDVKAMLQWCREQKITEHLEVETYTWEVLPQEWQAPLAESISRELAWVLREI